LHDEEILGIKNAMLDPNTRKTDEWYGTPYPFGVDPVWQVSENKIVFLNAFKMKVV
jgi:V-type H+-transporting ATPase subunit a